MNCKTLYCGGVSFPAFRRMSPFVRKCIAATLFDFNDDFGIPNDQIFTLVDLWKYPDDLCRYCLRLEINSINVVRQYPESRFFTPDVSNVRVNIHRSKVYSTYVEPIK